VIEGWCKAKDGTSIYYKVEGEGIPLVMSDGIGCDGYAWTHLIPFFKDRFKTVHWHYRGHGRSEMPHDMNLLSTRDLCEDLNCIFEELNLEPAVLLGHSMGVQVVLEFWHMFPEKVRGLIPVNGSYGNPLDTFHDNKLLATLFPYLKDFSMKHTSLVQRFWEVLVPSELAMNIALQFEVNKHHIKRDEFKPYFDHIGHIDVELFLRMLEKAQGHTAKPYLPEIDVPTLVVGGEKDTFTPGWLSRQMARLIPNSQLLMVPEGSHTALIEIPELFLLRVEKFLEQKIIPQEEYKKSKPTQTAKPKSKAAPKAKSPKPKATSKTSKAKPAKAKKAAPVKVVKSAKAGTKAKSAAKAPSKTKKAAAQ